LPCLHYIDGQWHLYYSGRSDDVGNGLQGFRGIGLATSKDGLHFERYSAKPVLDGGGVDGFLDNQGIAGGGRITEMHDEKGALYRMDYTLAVGHPSPDLLVDQEKHAAVAYSRDGITWFDRKIILSPRREAHYENAAVIALNRWKTASGYRAVYAGIGSQFGAYSICEATSSDGENWERGEPGQNLALEPRGEGWESQMVEYPNVLVEDGKLRLFYCGNGYGKTGIGTALAEPLEPLV
jgi:hypothetical protein